MAGAAVLAAVVAAAVVLQPERTDGSTVASRTPAAGTAPPSPSAPPPSPVPPPPSPAAPGGPAEFSGAVLTLPAGWRLEGGDGGRACVTRAPGGCELELLLPDVAERAGADLPELRTDDDLGWSTGAEAPDCRSSRLVVRDLAPIDDKRAEYREWALDCAGEPARLRLWWLPRTRLAVVDRSGDPAVADVLGEVVRTADLSGLRAG